MSVVLGILTPKAKMPLEKRFASGLTIGQLKDRLYPILGVTAESMALTATISNSSISLSDDNRTLQGYGLTNGCQVRVESKEFKDLELFNDLENVEKYVMSEEVYNKREDSFRKFKQSNPEIFKPKIVKNTNQIDEKVFKNYKIGSRCEIEADKNYGPRRGEIKYVGELKGYKNIFIGIKLDEPLGKNNGTVKGKKYFECVMNYGVFVRPYKVQVGDFPEEDYDLDEF
ncbi:tubulin folding cofactor b [Anaeramoeba flamelloides]|uniref:Tubulin folding cofactor b n=1 Tax=Anaeramoeba flamelloides TaxID=1746091 RepID=A0AAV8AB14_9EUKA|nr:tubulin folding cofactor b [Anaeramoeba flamelloides]KAJ6230640.1 tubulin folding cofactor b [Anaeramoeba flamelloides]|eukprot:Anaeramoba_flamelloidesa91424_56.p1 GENE.a91424_56~~a91424_56.p1  ORF type:complete len:228 (-),score=69.01 a91424_56:9-692(-)